MPKLSVRNVKGETVGDFEVSDSVFGAEANIHLMHQAVVAEEANARQGTSKVKTRAEVRGGGRKPFRQKGTGRARQGTIRAPHMYHGGVVFGPSPRSYSKALPKKMRRGALKSALSARLDDGDLMILDTVLPESISTRKMVASLESLGAVGRVLVVTDTLTREFTLSTRNIPGLMVRLSPAVSVRDVLVADKIIMSKVAVERLQEVLA